MASINAISKVLRSSMQPLCQTLKSSLVALLLMAAVFLLAGPVQAQTLAELSPSEIVAKRQQVFEAIEKTFKQLRFNVVNQRTTDLQQAQSDAQRLVQLSNFLPVLFTQPATAAGRVQESHAAPEVWTESTHFKRELNEFLDRMGRIDEELRFGSLNQAADMIDVTAKSCRQCHRLFKTR
ncbi:cytochrome c [Terasakiispira papahanaumokuakeensis]|nr:cytochrome c [Terasakiispira papahanaumokuakeensis]